MISERKGAGFLDVMVAALGTLISMNNYSGIPNKLALLGPCLDWYQLNVSEVCLIPFNCLIPKFGEELRSEHKVGTTEKKMIQMPFLF